MNLKGILNKRQREMIEREKYIKNEYGNEMKDEWYYGNDLTNDFDLEGFSLYDDRLYSVGKGITIAYTK